MASTQDQIAATADPALRARLIAMAQMEGGLTHPGQWVDQHIGTLCAGEVTVGGETTSVTDVYAYATAQQPPPPGEDPSAVTDDHLRAAVQAVQTSTST